MKQCPNCGSKDKQVKAGRNNSGTQRCKCVPCGRIYTPVQKRRVYPQLKHLAAAILYQSGFDLREVAMVLSVRSQTADVWVRRYRDYVEVRLVDYLYDEPAFTHLGDRSR